MENNNKSKQQEFLISQEYYSHIDVDNKEADIIQLWQRTEVIQVERENIQKLISVLQSCIKSESKFINHEIGEGC